MTDTPVIPRDQPPVPRSEMVKGFIGDLARPFAIYVGSASAGWATVVIAHKVNGFAEAALFIGAVYAGLAGLYGFKSWERRRDADVAIAQANSTPPPA